MEPMFHADSYGYRQGKSAKDAVGKARKRCRKHDGVLDLDIQGFFDNLDWRLLMKAVRKHARQASVSSGRPRCTERCGSWTSISFYGRGASASVSSSTATVPASG